MDKHRGPSALPLSVTTALRSAVEVSLAAAAASPDHSSLFYYTSYNCILLSPLYIMLQLSEMLNTETEVALSPVVEPHNTANDQDVCLTLNLISTVH